MVMSYPGFPRRLGLRQRLICYYFIKGVPSKGNRMWEAGRVGELTGVCVTEPAAAWYVSLLGPSSKRPYG